MNEVARAPALTLAAGLVSLPSAQRQQRLERLDRDNPELGREVRRLIELCEDRTLGAGDAVPPSSASLPEIPGFALEALVGRGGMGSVYRARQLQPSRVVALKLLRSDLITGELQRRFEQEGELLARLEHPHIARIYQGGRTAQPGGDLHYLVMEYVEGVDLTRHVREARPTLRQRVELVIRIARAVQYAHQRGVIHRDLKPSNVLVDVTGAPRILDFGVARTTDEDATLLTRSGELVGTLAYMAPEQVAGEGDTRTDVYALGAILYQLLSDQLPHDLAGLTLLQAIRTIGEAQPVPLRRRLPNLPRGLDRIVMSALARDPERRYATAAELAADLERFLQHRPLAVQPPGALESLNLFARRHRVGVVAAALVLLAMVAATGVSARYALLEAAAREQAETRSSQLAAVNQFLQDMLLAADPEQAQGREIPVGDVLDDAARNLDRQTLPPGIEAELRTLLGTTFMNLGVLDAAESQLRLAIGEWQRSTGVDGAEALDAHIRLASVLANRGRYEEADAELDRVEPLVSARFEADSVALAEQQAAIAAARGQALAETSQLEAAVELLRPAMAAANRELGPTNPATMTLKNNLAQSLFALQRYDEHDAIMAQLIADRSEVLGPLHPHTLVSRNSLAISLAQRGQLEAAEAALRPLLTDRIKVLGARHPGTTVTRSNLVVVLVNQGRLEEAEPLAREVLAANLETLGPTHPKTLGSRNTLAWINEDQGRTAEAEALYREVLVGIEASGQVQPDLIAVRNNLAMLLMNRGALEDSRAEFERLLAETVEALGRQHPYYWIFANNYGELLTQTGDFPAARRWLTESLAGLSDAFGADHPRVEKARVRLAALETAGQAG